ncbi:MAG: hypothetical protein ABIJ16_13095, partial [Bacteroidota bacterium]
EVEVEDEVKVEVEDEVEDEVEVCFLLTGYRFLYITHIFIFLFFFVILYCLLFLLLSLVKTACAVFLCNNEKALNCITSLILRL